MPTKVYGFDYAIEDSILDASMDKKRFSIVENELYGIYEYVGPGIIDGWDVISWNDSTEKDADEFTNKALTYIDQNEINSLSNLTRQSLLNLNYKMVIKIMDGDGIVDHYAAFTTSTFYYGFPNSTSNVKYYVYAVPTPSLSDPQKHFAQIYITNISDYDTNYIATYLGTINITYNSLTKENYISSVENEDSRRRELYRFKGINSEELKNTFLKHVHDGRDLSQIKLNTSDIANLQEIPPVGSPLFTIDPIDLQQSLSNGPEITSFTAEESGGVLASGTWYYKITFNVKKTDGSGIVESLPGDPSSIVIQYGKKIQLQWEKVIGADSYNVYRTENANDSSSHMYQLFSEVKNYKCTDDGSTSISTTLPPTDDYSEQIIGKSSITADNILSINPNDSVYLLDNLSNISPLNYNIPGIFQVDSSIGANKSTTDSSTSTDQNFYKVEVRLNGSVLASDDYKIITQEVGIDTSGNAITNGVIELKNNITSEDVLEVIKYIDPTQTQVSDKLRANRIDSIDASTIKYGTISKRYLMLPNHYGTARIKDNTILIPYCDMRTKDYNKYYILNPNSNIQYDDEILYIGNFINVSNNIGTPTIFSNESDQLVSVYVNSTREVSASSVKIQSDNVILNSESVANSVSGLGKYIVGTRSGNYITSDFQYFEKLSLDTDEGIIIDCIDNLVFGLDYAGEEGVENKYYETFVLLDTGKVFYSRDNGITWDEISYPRSDFFTTAFRVSTSKEQVESGDETKGYKYGRRFYIGGYTTSSPVRSGVWTDTLTDTQDISDLGWNLMPIWSTKQNQQNIIYSICEIITYSFNQTDLSFTESWDSTIYVGSNSGLYKNNTEINNIIYPNIVPKEITWITNLEDRRNNIIIRTIDSIYTTKDAEYVSKNTPTGSSASWSIPFDTNIGRFYKIADINSFLNENQFYSSNYNNKYYMFGSDTSIWYGTETSHPNGGLNGALYFDVEVSSMNGAGGLHFDVLVNGNNSNGALYFDVEVYSPSFVNTILNYSDQDYASYWQWNLPYWNKSVNSEYATKSNSLIEIGYIRQYTTDGPAPKDGIIGRTGPISGQTIFEEENENYINFTYLLKDNNTKIDISFENNFQILNSNNNSTLSILNLNGSGLLDKNTNILWINTESYALIQNVDNNGNNIDISFENTYASNSEIPTQQLTSTNAQSNPTSNTEGVVIENSTTSNTLGVINSSGLAYISNSVIAATQNGLWLSEMQDGRVFNRVYSYFKINTEPNMYRDDILINENEYSLNYIDQSLDFNIQQKMYNKITMEKDFKEYFNVNGPWNADSNIVVYINNFPTNLPYELLPEKGLIRFEKSLNKNDVVQISIIGKNSYLDLTSTNKTPLDNYLPHSEIDTSYVISEDIITYLSEDIPINSNRIRVLSTSLFSNNTKYIKIDNEIIPVYKYDQSSFVCSGLNTKELHIKGTSVYLMTIDSILGIQDRLSMQTSNGTPYYMHSNYVGNLLNLTSSLRHVYPEIDGQSSLLLPNYNNEEGFNNSIFHIFDSDTLDDLNSFINYRIGEDYDIDNPPKDSLQVFCSYKNIDFNTDGSLVGTDTGIWKKNVNNWELVSSCDNCTRVYFIKKIRGNIWAGTDNGIYISSDDGSSWVKNATYNQDVFDIMTGDIRWTSPRKQYDQNAEAISTDSDTQNTRDASTISSKHFESFMKNDGIVFVLYNDGDDGTGDFDSDHVLSMDNSDVFASIQYEGRKQEAATATKSARISKEDIIVFGGESGLYILSNTRTKVNGEYHPYSNFISESNMIDSNNRLFTTNKIDNNGDNIIENIKIYDMLFSPKLPYYDSSIITNDNQFINDIKYNQFGNIYSIFLTNDGIKIAENQVWMKAGTGEYLSWVREPLKGLGYVCYCHIVVRDINSDYVDETFKHFVRLFVGTNKGVIQSTDGGFTWAPCSRFPNIDNLTTYGLEYSANTLYAFTNRGIYSSSDFGETWIKSFNLSNYQFFDNNKFGQVFKPVISNITKISIWMKKKFDINKFDDYYGDVYESISNLVLKIYDTNVDGSPGTNLIYTSATNVLTSAIIEPRWVNFICSTTLDTSKLYAIVIEEQGYTEEFTGVATAITSTYTLGGGYVYSGSSWSAMNNLVFLVHYDLDNQITETEFEVVYNQDNANNIAKTIYNNLILDTRFVFSFIIDATGSMLKQDVNSKRLSKINSFINHLLGRNRLGYIDVWSFDNKLNQITNGLTINYDEISSSILSIISSGTDSEVWSGSAIGLGNASYTGIQDAIIRDNSYSYIIDYMDLMYRIDYNYLYTIDNSYDKTKSSLLSEKYIHLRDIVIEDYIFTFGRVGFVFTDGFDNSSINENWRSPAFAMNGIKQDEQCPLYFFGIGRDNNQTAMIASSEEAGGKFYQISDNFDDMDIAFDDLLNGDHYIWNGDYNDHIDLGDTPQYIKWIKCPATIPIGYLSSDLIQFNIRYTSDFNLWSDWINIPVNTEYALNVFANYIEYSIVIKQGDAIPGDPYHEYDDNEYVDYGYYETLIDEYAGPIVGALKYTIVYPAENTYILNLVDSGNIFEYELNYNSINSNISNIEWKIGRGDTLRTDLYSPVKISRKATLPIRERSISYRKEIPITYTLADSYPNDTAKSRKVFIAISSNNIITWTDEDTIEIYLGSQLLDPNQYQYRSVPTYGMIEFTQAVQGLETLTIKITKPGVIFDYDGENTIRLNNTTFLAQNGPWANDARVIIYRNEQPILGGFFVIPYEGKIIFDDYVLDNEVIRIYIQNSYYSRICAISKNYSNTTPLIMEDVAITWSTIDNFNNTEILDSIVQPVVENVELKTDIYLPISSIYIETGLDNSYFGNMSSIPYVKYDYTHQNGMPEQGTEIRWYRMRKDETEFSEITEYYNLLTKKISDDVDYWNPNKSSTWMPSSVWTEGDTWKVSVLPKTINSIGSAVYSNEFVVSNYNNTTGDISYISSKPPVILNLKIYKNDIINNPNSISGSASHLDVISVEKYSYYEIPSDYTGDLRIKFQYADSGNTDITILLGYMIIKWFKRGQETAVYDSSAGTFVQNSNGITDKWLVPTIVEGESWYAQLIPYDGISYGTLVHTLRLERASKTI